MVTPIYFDVVFQGTRRLVICAMSREHALDILKDGFGFPVDDPAFELSQSDFGGGPCNTATLSPRGELPGKSSC